MGGDPNDLELRGMSRGRNLKSNAVRLKHSELEVNPLGVIPVAARVINLGILRIVPNRYVA